MSNQKGFSKVAIIIIILILIGGAYFVFSKKDKNIPAQNTENQNSQSSQSIGGDLSKNEMSDWKTYKNDQYGFEFKYPVGWEINYNAEAGNSVSGKSIDNSNKLYICPSVCFDRGLESYDEFKKEVFVDGKKFTSVDFYVKEPFEGSGNYSLSILRPINNSEIGWSSEGRIQFMSLSKTKNKPIIFEEILSTFKFIK